jgi:DNA-binding NarL/FixJ family response regulator
MTWNAIVPIHEPVPGTHTSPTPREYEVMGLIAMGLTNKEIATRLGLTVHTVKCHVHSVLSKLALRSRLEIAVRVHTGDLAPRMSLDQQVA